MAYITLNKKHFFHNLDLIKQQITHKEKIAIVLKDNAYGHGLIEMAQLAHEYGLKHAVVRTNDEANKIAEYFQTVLVLADKQPHQPQKNLFLAVNDINDLNGLSADTAVELKVDTGMHRNGIHIDDLKKAFTIIKERKLSLKGIFTHHRSADILSSEYFWQEQQFQAIKKEALKLLKAYEMPDVRYHSQNSSATFRSKNAGDIVRVGIAAYGLLEMPKALLNLDFKPVLALWADKLHSFQSFAGHKHGYEGKGVLRADSMLSTYDIGYADGLLRLADDKQYQTLNGSSFLGRISMDNIIVASEDEQICIYEDARIYAKAASTISYEVTTRLPSHLRRFII